MQVVRRLIAIHRIVCLFIYIATLLTQWVFRSFLVFVETINNNVQYVIKHIFRRFGTGYHTPSPEHPTTSPLYAILATNSNTLMNKSLAKFARWANKEQIAKRKEQLNIKTRHSRAGGNPLRRRHFYAVPAGQ